MERVNVEVQRSLADRVIFWMSVLITIGFFCLWAKSMMGSGIVVSGRLLYGSGISVLVFWSMYMLHRHHAHAGHLAVNATAFICLLLLSFEVFYNPLKIKDVWIGFLFYPVIISLFKSRRLYLIWSGAAFLVYVLYFTLQPMGEAGAEQPGLHLLSKWMYALSAFTLGWIIMGHLQRMKSGYLRAVEERNMDFMIRMLYALIPIVERKTHTSSREIEESTRLMKLIIHHYPKEQVQDWEINLLAVLHYVSKIKWPDYVFEKPGRLTTFEYQIVQEHCFFAKEMLYEYPACERVTEALLYHHERLDGTGYPYRLKGEEIPFLAQVLGIVDNFVAMTVSRPYRAALSPEEALKEIVSLRGKAYDETIVDTFQQVMRSLQPPGTVNRENPIPLVGENQYVG